MQDKPIDLSDLNTTVRPGDDFYEYANGGWLKNAKIPDDKSLYSAFDAVQESIDEKIKDILFRAAERKGDTTNVEWLKIGDFFSAGMDTAALESAGYRPIKPDLDIIGEILTPKDVVREIAREAPIGGDVPFSVYVDQDSKNATEYVLSFAQSGLGLPDRDYYLEKGEHFEKLREAYKQLLTKMFTLIGNAEDKSAAMAKDVFDLEMRLAEVSLTRLDYRDPDKIYNKLTFKEMVDNAPGIDWDLYFQNLGITVPEYMVVDNPLFLHTLGNLLTELPINVWKDYLTVHYVLEYARYLSKDFEDARFEFYGTALSGVKEQRPRWKRVGDAASRALGMAIGKVYVAEYFPPAAKQRMVELVENLRSAYRGRMQQLSWLSEDTKKLALEKLDAIVVKVGYPDKWRDYTDLVISRDSYAMNMRNAFCYLFNDNISKLGKPVDRTEWFMTPQMVNAYYHPKMNEIVFPAGILQPPFFNMNADDAVNYGAIGVVIAHEITHGFDDQGRRYNKDGNLIGWWTEQDSIHFVENTKLFVDQFSAFEPIPGHHVDGRNTLGENIADYGGLAISLTALENLNASREKEGIKIADIDGYTPYQRFFLAYAKVWRNLIRPEELKRRLTDDVHAPGMYRVNGGVYNIDGFYKAFEVDPKSPYYRSPEQRPAIW